VLTVFVGLHRHQTRTIPRSAPEQAAIGAV